MAVTYVSVGTNTVSASAATLTPALPGSLVNGDMLIGCCASKNNATHTWPGGWATLMQNNVGASFTVSIAMHMYTTGDAAPAVTWTGAVACGAQIAQYTGVSGQIGAASANPGGTTPHTNPGITTTRQDSLVIYNDACSINTVLATPSTWAEDSDTGSATSGIEITWGHKAIGALGTASGSISVTGGNTPWIMLVMELLNTEPPDIIMSPLSDDRRR